MDCLVIKMEGQVENANLPKLNTILIDAPKATGASRYPITIQPGNEAITIKSKVLLHTSTSYTDAGRYEYTYPANGFSVEFYVNPSDIPDSGINECFELTGGIYSMKKFGIFVNIAPTLKNGVSVLLNNGDSLIAYGGIRTVLENVALPTTIQYVQTQDVNYDYFKAPYTVHSYRTTNGIILNATTKANTSVNSVMQVRGVVTDLPKNIMYVYVNDGRLSGTIEGLVADMITRGRTEGSIYLVNIATSTAVTYNGQALYTALGLTSQSNKTLNWDSNGTITWTNDMPAGTPSIDMNNYIPV